MGKSQALCEIKNQAYFCQTQLSLGSRILESQVVACARWQYVFLELAACLEALFQVLRLTRVSHTWWLKPKSLLFKKEAACGINANNRQPRSTMIRADFLIDH